MGVENPDVEPVIVPIAARALSSHGVAGPVHVVGLRTPLRVAPSCVVLHMVCGSVPPGSWPIETKIDRINAVLAVRLPRIDTRIKVGLGGCGRRTTRQATAQAVTIVTRRRGRRHPEETGRVTATSPSSLSLLRASPAGRACTALSSDPPTLPLAATWPSRSASA